ncbi:hypothetical protein BDDG_03775 [Blastomyces dermatitidis ATCC 18188]|uniref:CENP-V/GFA domain-containing protein n=1 Tax=Ajellomyces dermatitidis (strain ATCC 18188 / CBS 674.68) TaxID=653446 RepID=F2TC71_AJEDA|nr:hypothetical protein BDDG_03775 [Blastomyces dermatitidis ATCC 18188]EQL37956.1 hypothetical protein BDFG_00975 [Blastomyces dermatitidis ATCC 26199]
MDRDRTLRGSCSCGRIQYAILIPRNAVTHAEVYFDTSSDRRRNQAAPLTAWLRVPLDWYQSTTTSYFPDETHSAIRRTFIPPNAPHSQRNFCGFCGTPMSYWSENPPEEAEFISVTIGSLFSEDQGALEDLDLLPSDVDTDVEVASGRATPTTSTGPPVPSAVTSASTQLGPRFIEPRVSVKHRFGIVNGIPWFEEMMQGSRLGRVGRRRRGVGISADRSTRVEWEVSEWHDDGLGPVVEDLTPGSGSGSASDVYTPSRASKRKTPEVDGGE